MASVGSSINGFLLICKTEHKQLKLIRIYLLEKTLLVVYRKAPSWVHYFLALIYINDIQECSEKLKFFLFADDTNILYADKNLRSLELIVNH